MIPRTAPALNLPLLFTILSWAFNFVALKLAYEHVQPPAVALMRTILMYATLVAICVVQRYSLAYRREDLFRVLLLGFSSLGIYMVLFLEGMRDSNAAEAAIILATGPIFTWVFAVMLRQEGFSFRSLVGALIAVVGVSLVVLAGHSGESSKLRGSLLILACSVVWALSAVQMRPLMRDYAPVQLLTLSMPGAFPVMLLYGYGAFADTSWLRLSSVDWLLLFHISVLSGTIAFAGFYAGVRTIGAAGAMLYQYFVPPLTALFAWMFLGSALVAQQLVGLLVVIVGVAMATRYRRPNPDPFASAQPVE